MVGFIWPLSISPLNFTQGYDLNGFYSKLEKCDHLLALGMWRVSRGIFKDIWEEAEEAEK